MITSRKECIDNMSDILIIIFVLIVCLVLNIFAIVLNDYKEWFEEFREYSVCELILVFTLFLPTTILFLLFWILSIKPFERKEK